MKKTMKRISLLLMAALLAMPVASLPLTAYADAQMQSTYSLPAVCADKVELIGAARADVFAALGVSESDATDTGAGQYILPDTQTVMGDEYKVWLEFDTHDDTLYGFRYVRTEAEAERTAQLLDKLLTQARTDYGAPDTYVGISERLSAQTDLAAALTAGGRSYYETWNFMRPENFVLNLSESKFNGAGWDVSLEYRVQILPIEYALKDAAAPYSQYIGTMLTDACKNLGLAEAGLSLSYDGLGLATVMPVQHVAGHDATLLLEYGVDSDNFYGFKYVFNAKNAGDAAQIAHELLEQALQEYREPDTYEGLDNRMYAPDGNMYDAEGLLTALESSGSGTLAETWNLPTADGSVENFTLGTFNMILKLAREDAGKTWVELEYRVVSKP